MENLQQGIDDRRVAAGPTEMVDQPMQTLAGGRRPQLLEGDWQIDDIVEVTR